METRTAVVTGASSGVGYELLLQLLRDGWRAIALNRSDVVGADEADAALVEQAKRDGRLRVHRGDLMDRATLDETLATIQRDERVIDLVVNNAGVSLDAPRAAPSGRDVHFEVNVLAPYLVTTALSPLVAASTDGMILNVASNALLQVKRLDLPDLVAPRVFRKLLGTYAESKLALALWTYALAPTLAKDGVTLASVCPGPNDTSMTRGRGMPSWLVWVVPFLFGHPKKGARRVLDAALGRQRAPSGAFVNRGKPARLPLSALAPEVLAFVASAARKGGAAPADEAP
ncbi:SDR family NAD(P)-dependent oxidoreductase [Corallococcus terminator]